MSYKSMRMHHTKQLTIENLRSSLVQTQLPWLGGMHATFYMLRHDTWQLFGFVDPNRKEKEINLSFFIQDRVWKRLQGWNKTLLSREGKAILIKIIAQVIPNFLHECVSSPSRPLSEYWEDDELILVGHKQKRK